MPKRVHDWVAHFAFFANEFNLPGRSPNRKLTHYRFFISVASKGLRVCVSGLESTLVGFAYMLILKEFPVNEEAATVVEMECVGVPAWGRLRRGWAGPRWFVGNGWRDRRDELGCGKRIGLVGGWYGGVGAGAFVTTRGTGGGRGRCADGGCFWGEG